MFRYRAVKKHSFNNIKWYSFSLRDCPVFLWNDSFILSNKPNTPILVYNTIVRGHPTIDMFEGDRVYDNETNEELGIIVYHNGFFIQKESSSFKKHISLGHIYIRRGDKDSIKLLQTFNRTPIKFKYDSLVFDIEGMVFLEGDILHLIIKSKNQKVNIKYVTELLLYNEETDYMVYTGDFINGKFITINDVTNII